jgi:energy-coupling factor transporter ATP-binding protein EcfA2
MPLINIENLRFEYTGSDIPALQEINLSIEKGEFILLIGPSGCGKTSLCRCLNGLIPHFYPGNLDGEVIVDRLNTKDHEVHELAVKAGLVFQNPENQLVSLNVERELAFASENLGLPREEIRKRVDDVTQLLSLEDLKEKPPHELSGGEQQRVAIASVLTLKPKILVLDEPTANLDPVSAQEVIRLLLELNKRQDLTIILVEHRLDMVIASVNRVLVMDQGRIVFDDSPKSVFEQPQVYDLGVSTPKVAQLFKNLRDDGWDIPTLPLTVEEALTFLKEKGT